MQHKKTNAQAEDYVNQAPQWRPEMKKLRQIALECGLDETYKWGKPCYVSSGKNIVLIQGFKEFCALLFFKGYLLKDPAGILIRTGPNTCVGRQARFTGIHEITRLEPVLKAYIREAADREKNSQSPQKPGPGGQSV